MKGTVFVIATIRPWNIEAAERFIQEHPQWEVHLVTDRSALTPALLAQVHPSFVFFPHWSWMIPAEIYTQWTCVVFHMTDLPFGRGGSPLQNLLSRGITRTKISALKVTGGVDEGPIYLKRDLDLSEGSAEAIYRRAAKIIFGEMIPYIVTRRPEPVPQVGEGVVFPRRRPEESAIVPGMSARQLYDHIRMLDAEGYPRAFLRWGSYRMEFSEARLEGEEGVRATVRIRQEEGKDDQGERP